MLVKHRNTVCGLVLAQSQGWALSSSWSPVKLLAAGCAQLRHGLRCAPADVAVGCGSCACCVCPCGAPLDSLSLLFKLDILCCSCAWPTDTFTASVRSGQCVFNRGLCEGHGDGRREGLLAGELLPVGGSVWNLLLPACMACSHVPLFLAPCPSATSTITPSNPCRASDLVSHAATLCGFQALQSAHWPGAVAPISSGSSA